MAALRRSEFSVIVGVQTETVLFVGDAVEDIWMVPDLRWFELLFFNFTMVQK